MILKSVVGGELFTSEGAQMSCVQESCVHVCITSVSIIEILNILRQVTKPGHRTSQNRHKINSHTHVLILLYLLSPTHKVDPQERTRNDLKEINEMLRMGEGRLLMPRSGKLVWKEETQCGHHFL